jgi:hypothetical protein
MELQQAIKEVSAKFKYRKDKNFLIDSWSVMQESNGVYYGDCDDFVLTVFWQLADKQLGKFLWNLFITHQYGVMWCRTDFGELHFAGKYKGLWFDNWTKKAVSEEQFFSVTKHRKLMQMPMLFCALQVIKGYFKR